MLTEDQKIKQIIEFLSEESFVRQISDEDLEKISSITVGEVGKRCLEKTKEVDDFG